MSPRPYLLLLPFVLAFASSCRESAPGGQPTDRPAGDASIFRKDTGPSTGDTGMAAPDASAPVPDTGTNQDSSVVADDSGVSHPDAAASFDAAEVWDSGEQVFPDAFAPDAIEMDAAPSDAGIEGDVGFAADASTVPSFDPVARAQTLATAICHHRTRCAPALYGYRNEDQAACVTSETATYESLFSGMVGALSAGAVSFGAPQFDACVAAYHNADCELGFDVGACTYFTGGRTTGDACSFHQECGPSGYCQRPSLGTCGTCALRAQASESCAASLCAPGLACAQVSTPGAPDQSVCVPATGNISESCGTVGTGLCRGQLQCVNGTCASPAMPGAACDTSRQSGPDCNLLASSICSQGLCVALTWSTPSGMCAPSGPAVCNDEGNCNSGTMSCDPLPTAGQACASGRCAPDAYCDATTCRAKKSAGQTCASSAECTAPFDCAGPTGQKSCQRLAWQSCGSPATDGGIAGDGGPSVDAGIGDAGTTDPFDPQARASELASAICSYYGRCEPARLEFQTISAQTCATQQTATFSANFAAIGSAVAAGRSTFRRPDFDACLQTLASADCDLGPEWAVCSFFSGARTRGHSCQNDAECAQGLYCSAAGIQVCGQCEPTAGHGEDCSAIPCGRGHSCASAGANSVCVPDSVGEGAPCGTVSTGLCRGALQCVTGQLAGSTCERPSGQGQLCDAQNQYSADCNLLADLTCMQGTCVSVSWVQPGQSCAGASGCNVHGLCDANTSTCLAKPAANQTCLENTCAVGAYCAGQTCEAESTQGVACVSSTECADPLYCVGPAGQASCQTPAWSVCP